ncbi:MAG TPA: hypothetical protein VKQ71_06380, partial [Acidimicrobiales bacterium]|nr:hypothetical protein [Acidimicrobiales bacterium]
DLGDGRLRFGGNSLDRVTAWLGDPPAPLPQGAHAPVGAADLRRLGALTAATGWRVDLGLTLGHPDPAAAADEATAAARLVGPGLATVEIGNEPDLFAQDPDLGLGGYSYERYRTEVDAYRSALAAAAPGLPVAGPDTAGLAWLPAYVRDEHAGLAAVTAHFYPLTRCGGAQPTIAALLSAATARREQSTIEAVVAAASRGGLPVRLDEVNSASCGGQDGVSNTLASALWMVRYLLDAGRRGVAGVNVHGGLAACRGYSPLCVAGASGATVVSRPGIDAVADASLGAGPDDGRLTAQPDFYGLLLVHQLEGGRWLPVTSDRPSPIEAFALAMPDSSVRVVLVNPDARHAAGVSIRMATASAAATLLRLTGPALGAVSGVQYGGAVVAPDGRWRPGPPETVPAGPDGVRVGVGPASAVVVTISPR